MANSVSDEQSIVLGDKSWPPRPLKSRPQDRFTSIADNPFYKNFGGRQSRSSRDVPSCQLSANADRESRVGIREELGEYKPGSGFVHKLMGKFASLEVKDAHLNSLNIKHASSVDDLEGPVVGFEVIKHEGRRIPDRNAQHRARSVDSLGRSKLKNAHPQSISVNLRHVERKWEHKKSPVKPSRDSHIVAPDVDLARDDIILIENPPPEPLKEKDDKEENERDMMGTNVAGLKDEVHMGELPKPNTVSTVRCMFESGLALSPTSTLVEPFSVSDSLMTKDTCLSPNDCGPLLDSSSRDAVLAAIPRETPKPAVLQSPRFNTDMISKHDASRSRFSWTSEHSKTGGSVELPTSPQPSFLPLSPPVLLPLMSSDSTNVIISTTAVGSESDIILSPTVISIGEVKEENGQGAENSRSVLSLSSAFIPPPRSTAAVKAIPLNRPVIPVRPVYPSTVGAATPSVPASYTTSLKKSSPVMTVAPFKEKAEQDDENRHLIFSKKDVGRKPKSKRVKDYQEVKTDVSLNDAHKNESNTTEGQKINNAEKVETENKTNTTHSKGRAPPIPRRPSEENLDSSNIEHFWRDSLKPVSADKIVAKSETVVTEETIQPEVSKVTPVREPLKPERAHRRLQPLSGDKRFYELELNKLVSNSSKLDEKKVTEHDSNFFAQIMPTLDLSSNEEEIVVEDKEEVEKATTEEPVRGIPSIIARRLQQNGQAAHYEDNDGRRPGELFGIRLGKTRYAEKAADMMAEMPSATEHAKTANSMESASSSNLPQEIEDHIASVRKRMQQDKNKKSSGVSQIFDSSQLQKKKREKQSATSNAQVPRLDLTSITDQDKSSNEGLLRPSAREIKPCNIEFIGANISIGRSLLDKNRKFKIGIRFHEVLVETFEYPSEESMLEEYIKDHPDEIFTLEEVGYPGESSDDSEMTDTPRNGNIALPMLEGKLLKSSTSLAHTGNLQSYRGRFVEDYQLGSVLSQPDKLAEQQDEPEPLAPDSLQLRPAQDNTQAWSEEATADLLF